MKQLLGVMRDYRIYPERKYPPTEGEKSFDDKERKLIEGRKKLINTFFNEIYNKYGWSIYRIYEFRFNSLLQLDSWFEYEDIDFEIFKKIVEIIEDIPNHKKWFRKS